jgi:hypothetical protein
MTRRAIKLEGTDVVLELSKFATPKTDKEFIHLDKLPDGSWRLLYNVEGTDIKNVKSLTIVREEI